MLHLAIIGIVCAVFALSEGTAFIGRKNYESDIFCHIDEGEPNVAKVYSPVVYNVEINNLSDCVNQKITNRSSSFFNDFIIKQYKSNRSSYCSIMNSAGENKNSHSNVGFEYQKRKLLWSEKNLKLSPKTLRPPMDKNLGEDANSEANAGKFKKGKCKKFKAKKNKLRKIRIKTTTTTPKPTRKVEKCDLDCEDKKMFFSLKNLKRKGKNKNVKLNSMTEISVKRKGKTSTFVSEKTKNFAKEKLKKTIPFFRHIKKLFRFSKDYLSDKKRDIYNVPKTVLENNVRSKNKAAHIINNNIFEVMRKPIRLKRNQDNSYSFTGSPVLPLRQNFIVQPYPYSANFKVKRSFLYPRINRKFFPDKIQQKRHFAVSPGLEEREIKFKNWPFHERHNSENSEARIKRFETSKSTNSSDEKSTIFESKTKNESSSFEELKSINEKSWECSTMPPDIEETQEKRYSVTLSQEANSSSSFWSTTRLNALNSVSGDQNNTPEHTLEKPFLERDMKKKNIKDEVSTLNFETNESDYNPMPEYPLRSSKIVQPYRKRKYELQNNDLLSTERFVKIRHALRNYLIRNNAWIPSKRVSPFENKRRCGRKASSAPHKCWRSAPLLCVPYIKKGQEDVLKFVIKFLQKMMGKPLPPKAEIFEKTKFKPYVEKEFENSPEEEDENECETTTCATVFPTIPQCDLSTTTCAPSITTTCIPYSTTPTTCLTTYSTTCPTTYSTTCPTTYSTTCPTTYPTTSPTTYPTTSPTTYPTPSPTTYSTTSPTTYPTTSSTTCPTTCPNTCPTSSSTHPINNANAYPTTTPPTCPSTISPNGGSTTKTLNYPSTYPPTCPPTYPSTYNPTYSPSYPSTFSTSFRSPSFPVGSGSTVTKSIPSLTSCIWPSTPKFNSATHLSTCPTSKPISNNQKPYFYQTCAPSREENKYPDFNSCPSGFPFMIPHMEQILNQVQNQINSDDRLTTVTPHLFTPYSTTSLYHAPFISTMLLSDCNYGSNSYSQIPGRSTSANAPYRTNSLVLHNRVQTKTEDASSTLPTSTMNYCSLYISSSPEGQEEYLSFTSVPYERPAECATMAYEFSQSVQQKPLLEATTCPSNCNQNKPSRLHCEACFANSEKRWPDVKNEPSWHSTTTPIPIEGTSDLLVTDEKDIYPSESFTDLYELEREKKLKTKLKKNLLAFNQRKELRYDDYSMNEHQTHDPDLSFEKTYKRLFRLKHHKKIPKTSYRPILKDLYPSDNDYGYDKYFMSKPDDGSSTLSDLSDGVIPMPPNFWKKSKKFKSTTSLDSLIRRKRENDYYFCPEKFDSYNDYSDGDLQDNNENFEGKHPNVDKTCREGCPGLSWTPPSYDMFSELAKAVTENNSAVLESVKVLEFHPTTVTDCNQKNCLVNSTHFAQTSDTSLSKTCTNSTQTVTEHFCEAKTYGSISTLQSNFTFSMLSTESTPPSNHSFATTTIKTTPQSNYNSTSPVKMTPQNYNSSASVPKTTLQSNNSTTCGNKTTLQSNGSATVYLIKTETLPDKTNTECSIQANVKSNGHDRAIDSKKSGKTSFFQTNSKAIQNGMENSGFLTTTRNTKKDAEMEYQELETNQDTGNSEEILPTTLKTASIVKGPKKLLTKPSPKVYSKVYPDSLAFEIEANETIETTTAATTKSYIENRTALLSSTSAPDIRLQLLAVCEGYLEVVKLIKAQNQTVGEDLDADLARYCENIISQSFNCQLDKPKKTESVELTSQNERSSTEVPENRPKNSSHSNATFSAYGPAKEFSDAQLRDQAVVNILQNSACENMKNCKNKKIKHEEANSTEVALFGGAEILNSDTKEKNGVELSIKNETQSLSKEETPEDFIKKGLTQEQVEMISLLKKRKKALLSWLLNSKEGKSEDSQETEYFEDEDLFAPDSDSAQYSGTIKPKRDEQSSGTTESNLSYANESIFPVYAKRYGYDKGGELREVEVLWRKVNEKTHEEKILKNLSVLALLLTSTEQPKVNREETKLVGNNGYENEEMSEIEPKSENKVRFAAADMAADCDKSTTPLNNHTENSTTTSAPNSTTTSAPNSTTVSCAVNPSTKSNKRNATYMFISKPDPSSIVGAPPNVTKTYRNVTQKASHKLSVAKDIFQEYTIEFLNYAVYILPIMFTVLFLFCVVCCALHILKTKKSIKRLRKKKKKLISTDDSTETTEESEHESKKKRWGYKRKRKPKDNSDDENLEEKRNKKFWNVLKLPSKSSKEFNDENNQTEKKKSFLRFLKTKKEEGKMEGTSIPLHELDEYSKTYLDSVEGKTNESEESHGVRKKKKEEDKQKSDDHSEAAERRELIALLEELKKIETESTGEKKEVKSVHVQYMTQEDENPAFQRSNFYYPYGKTLPGMPENYSFYNKEFPIRKTDPHLLRDYELYEDVNELTELLPCECSYYAKKNDYMRHCDLRINHEGRCERYVKIFRDSGVSRDKYFRDKNFKKNESENRKFIFNKYRSISTDTSEELMEVTKNNAGTEVRFTDTAPPFQLASKTKAVMVQEMDNFKRQVNTKKYVRLKDDGVLCRL